MVILALQSLPASATSADAELQVFSQLPQMTDARLSPDGTQVAFISALNGRYHVVIERFKPEFSRTILPPIDDLDFDWVEWASNERLVLAASYSARRSVVQTTETRLFSVAPDGEDFKSIIRPGRFKETGSRLAKDLPTPQLQDNVIGWLPADPDHILVALDSNFDGSDEVRIIDVTDGSFDLAVNLAAGNYEWLPDQEGVVRVGWQYDSDDNRLEVLIKDDDDWVNHSSAAWVTDGYYPVAFTSDPDVLYVQGSIHSGMSAIRTVRISTGEFGETIFERDNIDAGYVVSNDSTRNAAGVYYVEHLPAIEYFDDMMRRLKRNVDAALPNTTNVIASVSDSYRQVLILAYSDIDAGSYYLWDRDAKTLDFYAAQYKDLDEGRLSPVKGVSYKARDGLSIPAYLTLPGDSEGENLPTVVLPHGGPQARDDMSYEFISQFLASRGYAVLRPNFRGSSGYGHAFQAAGYSEWGGLMQDDVTDGANWLIAEGIADPDRICIVGASYGGYAAAMGAVKTPELYRCAASINGVLDLPRHRLDDTRYIGGEDWIEHMGLEGESAKAVSPYHQAESIKIPMLIVQSLDDTRVHREQGQAMANRLQELGKDVTYVEVEFGGHSIRNVDGRAQLLFALDAFLEQHVGD